MGIFYCIASQQNVEKHGEHAKSHKVFFFIDLLVHNRYIPFMVIIEMKKKTLCQVILIVGYWLFTISGLFCHYDTSSIYEKMRYKVSLNAFCFAALF